MGCVVTNGVICCLCWGVLMVKNNSKRGLYEWLAQRVTAVIVMVYFVVLAIYFFSGPVSYEGWSAFNAMLSVRILTILSVFAILWHAWIGLWTVMTDYIKCVKFRLLLQIALLVLLFIYGIWALILTL